MSREGGLEHLTLKPRIRTILTGWERNQDWRFEQAKDRLAAANDAIRTTRTFFFALLSIAAYIGDVIAGTARRGRISARWNVDRSAPSSWGT